ncbi:MAG: hypothetical protein KF886_00195 [Candidatus Hydrogenedentes bacterium]|nr:hypothetical protein [Candidatus Hydrogenedentota bacterium]
MNGRNPLTVLIQSTTAFIAIAVPAILHAETAYKPRTLADYPPAIVEWVVADFEARLEALRADGAPRSVAELAKWGACPDADTDAYPLYEKALRQTPYSAQLSAVVAATRRPCYQYPVSARDLRDDVRKQFLPELDYLGEMRNMARMFSSEAGMLAAWGDTDGAVDLLCAGFNFLGHHARAPFGLMHLTRYACQSLIVNAAEEILNRVNLTGAQLERLNAAVARAENPDALAQIWHFNVEAGIDANPFSAMPSVHVIDAVYRAELLLLRAGIAIERFRLAEGEAPASLADLVPAYLPKLPLDPMNGAPLQYTRGEGEFALCSVGDTGALCADPLQESDVPNQPKLVVAYQKTPAAFHEMGIALPTREPRRLSRAEKRAVEVVRVELDFGSLHVESGIAQFSAGALNGGVAVLLVSVSAAQPDPRELPLMAAFFVKDGSARRVNRVAAELAPRLEGAPEHITFDRVRDAAY